MYWRDIGKRIRDEGKCPYCGKNFAGWGSKEIAEHFVNDHPEKMLDLFKNMTGCHHCCPFHRGGRHKVHVTCDDKFCPICGNALENWRIKWTANWMAKMFHFVKSN